VSEVNRGGPSEEAGIKPGDIITRLDDRSIDDSTELVVAIRSYAPGDKVALEVQRDGKASTFEVTLGSASGNR
jgi:putative serine protease PepD